MDKIWKFLPLGVLIGLVAIHVFLPVPPSKALSRVSEIREEADSLVAFVGQVQDRRERMQYEFIAIDVVPANKDWPPEKEAAYTRHLESRNWTRRPTGDFCKDGIQLSFLLNARHRRRRWTGSIFPRTHSRSGTAPDPGVIPRYSHLYITITT